MKKFKKVFLSTTSLLSMITLVGCKEIDNNNTSKKDEITVEEVKQEGLNQSYHVLEEIDFSNVKLTINYSNKTSRELTKGEVDIASENAKTDTEFVLYTSELSKQSAGSLQTGDYKIECSLKEETFKTRYTLCTVKVVDTYKDLYTLTQFNEPKSIIEWKNNINSSSQDSETSFKVKDDTYVIGDDNEFIYKPETLLLKKDSKTPTAISANIPLNVSITDLNNKVVQPGLTTYTFNQSTNGIKFSNTQIGNTFKIEYTPKEFEQTNDEALSLNVRVEDGYNAYCALDLGRLNLLSDQHIQDVIKDGPQDHVLDGYQIYNKNYELTHVYDKQAQNKLKTVHTYQIWKDFLSAKDQKDLNEINGIYLHNDIEITQDDIPVEYFISEEEAKDMANDTFSAGTLRDFSFVYSHFLIDSDFNFNGNYFNLDFTKIKPGRTNSGFDGANFWYKQNQSNVQMGHSAAFVFTNKIENSGSKHKTTMKNVQSIGNIGGALDVKPSTNTDDTSKTEKDPNQAIIDDAAGGLIFLKSCYGQTTIDNFIIKNYLIGLFPSGEVSYKCMEIKNGRVYNCFNSGIFSYCSTENELKNCEFKRFGGPIIFLNSRKWRSNEKDYYGASGIKIDKDCVFENYVDGTEPWFVINKATQTAAGITGMFETLMNSYLSSIIYKDDSDANASAKMNLIMVGLDNGFLAATEKTRVKCDMEGYNSFSTYDAATSDTFTSTASDIRTTFPYSIAGGMPIIRTMNKGDEKSKDIFGAVYPGSDQDTSHPAGIYKADALNDYHMPQTDGTQMFPNGNTLCGDYLQIFYPIANSQVEVAMLLTMHQLNLG